jgi:putative transposase
VVCEENPYFLQLVRYIHLNPLVAGIVKTLDELDSYPWSGHSAIIGKRVREWQDQAYVLGAFSNDPKKALGLYRAFMGESKDSHNLDGGSLVRSLGTTLSLRDGLSAHDARVLGSSDFVLRIRAESDRHQPSGVKANETIAVICKELGLNHEHLLNGSRTKAAAKARLRVIEELVIKRGLPLSRIARLIGISPSGVANIVARIAERMPE